MDSSKRKKRPRAQAPARRRAAPARPAAVAPQPGLLLRIIQAPPWKVALGLALLHLVLCILAFNPEPFIGGDNGAYLALARSLVQRHAYLELWDPAAAPHTQYPPVWPMIIATLSLVGIQGWVALKCVVLTCSVISVGLAYLWLRRTSGPALAMVAGLVLAVAPGVIEQAHWELSDVPAWIFTLLALWASTHLPAAPEAEGELRTGRDHSRWLAVLIAGAVLGNFTRAAGLPLVVAAFVWLALHRQWRDLTALAVVFVPLAFAWWLRAHLLGAPGYIGHLWAVDPYRPDLGNVGPLQMLDRMANNVQRYAGIHLPMLLAWKSTSSYLLGGGVLLLAAVGWALRLSRPGLAEIWVPLYAGLLLIWPATWSGERFLLPLLPLVLCYAFEVLLQLPGWLGIKWGGELLAAAVAGVLLGLAIPGLKQEVTFGRQCSDAYHAGDPFACMNEFYHDYFVLARNLRGKLPPGSAALTRKPTLFWMLSGYPGRLYPMSAEPDSLFAEARRAHAEYVMFDRVPDLAPLYLHPVLLKARDKFCVLKGLSIPNAAMLHIEPNGPRRVGVAENNFRVCGVAPDPSIMAPGQGTPSGASVPSVQPGAVAAPAPPAAGAPGAGH